MTEVDRPLRIASVAVSDLRVEQMGVAPGIKGRFGLLDERGTVMAFVLCHKYSERTYQILDALYESMEMDLLDIIGEPESAPGDVTYHAPIAGPPGDDEGMTFG